MTRIILYVDIPICVRQPQLWAGGRPPVDSIWLPMKKALSVAITYEDLALKWPNEAPPLRLPYTLKDPEAIRDILISKFPLFQGQQ